MERRPRASLALALCLLALLLAVSALSSSHWCAGHRKTLKPPCAGSATGLRGSCLRYNGSGASGSLWETGEDKFILRSFHTGIWISCEQSDAPSGEKCRSFISVAPPHERGVLWLCIAAECLYIFLLATGGVLMSLELCRCRSSSRGLKLNAFAAIFTVLSGLLGMVAHMMFSTAFQLTVSLGPEDWKPQDWDYSWSYMLAWGSFTACMFSSVTSINRYTQSFLEQRQQRRRSLEKSLRFLYITHSSPGSPQGPREPGTHSCPGGELYQTYCVSGGEEHYLTHPREPYVTHFIPSTEQ